MSNLFSTLSFSIITFGCQMNKHDSERVRGMLEGCGCTYVDSIEASDIVVYMTCCVREAADERLYGQVSSMKNAPLRAGSPLSKRCVCIGGCIGQRDGEKLIEEMSHVDVVFGTQNIENLPHLILSSIQDADYVVQTLDNTDKFSTSLPTHRENAWAAWLPITTGCDNFCTYCIVPYVRGREKSRTLEDIEAESLRYVSEGVKEITLLGQNVNSYGRDLYGKPSFIEALRRVDATGIKRLRFATSHPKDLTDEVISAFGQLPSLQPALHLPVQSGSNAILEKMNRKYTREHYLELIDKLRCVCPEIALSTDIIVGFPGESESDFQDTYDLVKQVGYTQVFTFIYSKREGTPAANMEDNTPHEVIQERFDRLVALVQDCAYKANQADLGKTVEIIVEGTSKRDSNILVGHSPKNQTVHAPLPSGVTIDTLLGKFANVHIDEAKTWYLSGTLIQGTETSKWAHD